MEAPMIELAGLLYTVLKDLKDYLKFDQEDKVISSEWLSKSGFKEKAEKEGFKLYGSRPEKIAERELEGYEVMFEIDPAKKKRYRLVYKDGTVLLGKRP
jgi:hypothetical protein